MHLFHPIQEPLELVEVTLNIDPLLLPHAVEGLEEVQGARDR